MNHSMSAYSSCARSLAFFAATLVCFMLAGCGQDPGETASPVIENWGPKQTVQGKGFNIQPSGISAMWIKATGLPDGRVYKIKIGEVEAQPARRTTFGVTGAVPDVLLKSVGDHQVVLVDDATGGEIVVGTFEVLPADQ